MSDIPSDVATNVVTDILKNLWLLIERQIKYVVQYKTNLQTLTEKASELEAIKSDLLKKIDAAQDKGEDIKDEVVNWHVKANQLELEVESWRDDINKNQQGCCHAWYLDWCSRRRLSRHATKKTVEISNHLPGGREFDNVSIPARRPGVLALPTSNLVSLESSKEAINKIMEFLGGDKDEVNIMGVYGTGGVGKTTLMRQLALHAQQSRVFNDVAFAPVSRNPNLKEIQSSIAELLTGHKMEEESLTGRAAKLSQILKTRRKVLVILDDLWEFLKLEEIGIPYGDDHRGCKVVVTSRELAVCNDMEAQLSFHIDKLSDHDSWDLFISKAGALVVSEELREVAWKMVKKCQGIPNSIVTLARAMKNKTNEEWNKAVKQLQEPTNLEVSGVQEDAVSILKFSFDQIQTEAAKLCLLYCCLFPEYYNISMQELVIYGLVDDLFPDVDTLGEVWNKMGLIVSYLRSSNLLLEGDREGCFKVHDDTRDVVKAVASKSGYNMMSKAGLKLKSWPQEATESFKRISLMDNDIAKLPDKPICYELLILLLQNNAIEEIPESFFLNMKALRYLDMSYTFISSLPESLQHLEGLLFLRLENTHLTDATQIRRLKLLQVLVLKGSCLERLPDGLEELTNLKLLDLSNNPYLQSFPVNLISKLTKLEELHIGSSFGGWEIEGNGSQGEAGFSEIASLSCLTVLHIHVKNTKVLSRNFDGPWGNLKKFCVCVHNDFWEIPSTRSMNLKNLSYPVANWVKVLLEKTGNLSLTHARDFEDIVQKDVQGLNEMKRLHLRACSIVRVFHSNLFPKVKNLEELHVEYCYSVKEVFYLDESEIQIEDEQANLSTLRELILVGLPKMTDIWEGNLSRAHLENLKLIKVKECGKLSYLFPLALAQKLHKLENLAVMNCDNMVEIIPTKMEQEGAHVMNFSNMEPVIFQNLQRLVVSKCKNMSSVLPLSLVRGLKQLQELTVISCNMEEIIAKDEEANEADDQTVLPLLKILVLKNMRKLGTFCKGVSHFEWPSLYELQVWNCPDLKKLPLGLHSAPKLRKFTGQLKWFENLEWEEEEALKMRLQPLLVEED